MKATNGGGIKPEVTFVKVTSSTSPMGVAASTPTLSSTVPVSSTMKMLRGIFTTSPKSNSASLLQIQTGNEVERGSIASGVERLIPCCAELSPTSASISTSKNPSPIVDKEDNNDNNNNNDINDPLTVNTKNGQREEILSESTTFYPVSDDESPDSVVTSDYSSPTASFSHAFSPAPASLVTSHYSSPIEQNSPLNSSAVISALSQPTSSSDTTSSIPCSPDESPTLASPLLTSPIDSRSASAPSSPYPDTSEKKPNTTTYNTQINGYTNGHTNGQTNGTNGQNGHTTVSPVNATRLGDVEPSNSPVSTVHSKDQATPSSSTPLTTSYAPLQPGTVKSFLKFFNGKTTDPAVTSANRKSVPFKSSQTVSEQPHSPAKRTKSWKEVPSQTVVQSGIVSKAVLRRYSPNNGSTDKHNSLKTAPKTVPPNTSPTVTRQTWIKAKSDQ